MGAHNLGEIILQDDELLVVVPRGDGPDVVRVCLGPKTSPENGITDLVSGKFLRQREKRCERVGDLASQSRVGSPARYGDAIRGIRYLEIVHGAAAKQLGQLDRSLIPGLNPVTLNRGILVIAPKPQRAGNRLAPVVLCEAAHQGPGWGNPVVPADAFFAPINRGGKGLSPILAVHR